MRTPFAAEVQKLRYPFTCLLVYSSSETSTHVLSSSSLSLSRSFERAHHHQHHNGSGEQIHRVVVCSSTIRRPASRDGSNNNNNTYIKSADLMPSHSPVSNLSCFLFAKSPPSASVIIVAVWVCDVLLRGVTLLHRFDSALPSTVGIPTYIEKYFLDKI